MPHFSLPHPVTDSEEKFRQMTQTPVQRLICTMAVPTILVMMVTSFYNMADTFFVGRISTAATAAVGISFPLMAVIQAAGFLLGIGAGNYTARLLGQKAREEAARVVNTSFFTALGLGLLITVAGQIFLQPLLRLLGATPTIAPYAESYIRILLLGAPWWTAALVLNIALRFQGSAFYGMIGMVGGNLLNIALDPIFIFSLHMGVAGAALATIISQLFSFAVLLYNCGRGVNIRISAKKFSPGRQIYRQILGGGAPSFLRQGLASLASVCLNLAAVPYGDAAIAAMSIVARLTQFANSALLGFGQGFQPVCGFNYGAGRYDRVREGFYFCVKLGVAVLVCCSVAALAAAPQIVALFRREDAEVIAIGARALRFQALTMPLFSWIIINNMMLQTVGKNGPASLMAVARQGLFFLPLILTLPRFFGLTGVQISQPLADAAAFALSLPLGISALRELREKQARQLGS